KRNPDLDWYAIFLRARQRGCGNAVLLGCAIAKDLLDVPVPQALAPLIESSARVRTLTASISRRMREDLSATTRERDLADLDLCDTWGRKAGFILGMVFTRTKGDHEAMPLPRRLWCLYHLTRPFRLATKMLSPTGRARKSVKLEG